LSKRRTLLEEYSTAPQFWHPAGRKNRGIAARAPLATVEARQYPGPDLSISSPALAMCTLLDPTHIVRASLA
jgi:hypothetical protein